MELATSKTFAITDNITDNNSKLQCLDKQDSTRHKWMIWSAVNYVWVESLISVVVDATQCGSDLRSVWVDFLSAYQPAHYFIPTTVLWMAPIKIHPILSTAASPSLEIGNCEWIPASTLFTSASKVAKKRISVQAVDGGLESDCDHKKCKVWIIHRGWSGLEIDWNAKGRQQRAAAITKVLKQILPFVHLLWPL